MKHTLRLLVVKVYSDHNSQNPGIAKIGLIHPACIWILALDLSQVQLLLSSNHLTTKASNCDKSAYLIFLWKMLTNGHFLGGVFHFWGESDNFRLASVHYIKSTKKSWHGQNPVPPFLAMPGFWEFEDRQRLPKGQQFRRFIYISNEKSPRIWCAMGRKR